VKRTKTERARLQRIWASRHHAARERRAAAAHAADDGVFPMRDTAYEIAQTRLTKANERFASADRAWQAAGCPDNAGRVTRPSPSAPTRNEPKENT
jgi:hypothetical protein